MKFLILPQKTLFLNANCMGYCTVDCWRVGPCQKYNGKVGVV